MYLVVTKQQLARGHYKCVAEQDKFLVDVGIKRKRACAYNVQQEASANRGPHTHHDEQEPDVAVLLSSSSDTGG